VGGANALNRNGTENDSMEKDRLLKKKKQWEKKERGSGGGDLQLCAKLGRGGRGGRSCLNKPKTRKKREVEKTKNVPREWERDVNKQPGMRPKVTKTVLSCSGEGNGKGTQEDRARTWEHAPSAGGGKTPVWSANRQRGGAEDKNYGERNTHLKDQ